MIKLSLVTVCLLLTLPAFAQRRPMFFPAEKNNVQVLPQRFEYNLLNESQLRIGDILVDSKRLFFQIEAIDGRYQAHFTWPASLIKEGELAIKNNSGIAVFSAKVNGKKSKIQPEAASAEEDLTRTNLATYSAEIPATVIEDMKYFPFMKFCIFRETKGTRLYLCSEEMAYTQQHGQWSVRPRATGGKAAQVIINGKTVGNQGTIYLNNREESIAFTADMGSGAFLEIETRRKDVDFKDVTESEDAKKMVLAAAGAEPVNEKRVRKLSDSEWQISLIKERPIVYLKGDGDIPMRQEFDLHGALPKAKLRPFLTASAFPRTYSRTLKIHILPQEGTSLSSAEDSTSFVQAENEQYLWTLNDLEPDKYNRRYVHVTAGEQKFVAAYDIYRGLPFMATFGAQYNAPAGLSFMDAKLQWWVENLFRSGSDFARLHWGLGIERNQHLTDNEDYPEINLTTFEIFWRAQPGMHLVDPSWGLTLPVQMIDGEGINITTFGLGAFWTTPSPWLGSLANWMELKAHYFAGSSGSDLKLSSAYQVKATAFLKQTASAHLYYGLNFSTYKYDPAQLKEDPLFGGHAGIAWKF